MHLQPLDHALAALILLVPPLWALAFARPRIRSATDAAATGARRYVYNGTMGVLWVLAALLTGFWISRGRSWSDLGLIPHAGKTLLIATVVVAVLITLVFVSRSKALRNPASLEKVRAQMRAARVERLMPQTASEFVSFTVLSLSAGICEELLYRGFLFWYLKNSTGWIAALALSSIAFGIAHAYQGLPGVLTTAVVGVLLGGLYLLSGFLVLPIVVHALTDLHSGHLGFVALTRAVPDEAPAI